MKITKEEAIKELKYIRGYTEIGTKPEEALTLAIQSLEAQSKPIMDEGLNGEPYVMLGNNSNRDVSNENVICPKCKGVNEFLRTETGYRCAYTDCGHEWIRKLLTNK